MRGLVLTVNMFRPLLHIHEGGCGISGERGGATFAFMGRLQTGRCPTVKHLDFYYKLMRSLNIFLEF